MNYLEPILLTLAPDQVRKSLLIVGVTAFVLIFLIAAWHMGMSARRLRRGESCDPNDGILNLVGLAAAALVVLRVFVDLFLGPPGSL